MKIGSDGSQGIVNNLNKNDQAEKKAFIRIASGKRINSASDDAAGLAIASSLNTQSAVLDQGSRNASYGQSLIDVASGAASSIQDIEIRKTELATQAANGTLSDQQRASIDQEYQALSQEQTRIVETTEFNGVKVFNQEGGTSFQVGTSSDSNSQINLTSVVISGTSGSVASQASALQALDTSVSKIQSISESVGKLGAADSRLKAAISNSNSQSLNSKAASARISDADIAEEAANLTSASIRKQGSVKALKSYNSQQSSNLDIIKKL